MTDPNQQGFLDRIDRIETGAHRSGKVARQHAKNGLIIGRAPKKKRRFKAPLRMTFLLATMFFGMKAALMTELGTNAYMAKVEAISAREGAEGWGGRLMAPDPVTLFARDKVGPFLAQLAAL